MKKPPDHRHGFVELSLLFALAVLAILSAVAMRLIVSHPAYWRLIVLLAAALGLSVLYHFRIIGASRFSRPRPPRPPQLDKTDKDDHED